MKDNFRIAMFGHKRISSREGGVEVVVEELSTRMVSLGHDVTCYSRKGHHISGAEFDGDTLPEYKGVKIRYVWTMNKKGLAAVSSSFFAALRSACSRAEIVHIHAEGPAFMCGISKLFGKRVIVTVYGLDWQRDKWKSGFCAKYIRQGERNAVRYADEIIVLSKGVQDYFRDVYNRETILIPNGVMCYVPRKPELIEEQYGLHERDYILYLGRLVPEKGRII